jgi:hypothetical protein
MAEMLGLHADMSLVLLGALNLNLKGPKDRKLTSKKLLPKCIGPFEEADRLTEWHTN